MLKLIVICVVLIGWSQADISLHVPRGSNNRLNEKRATRANNNRLYDSQNNNRGGYNVGDKGADPHVDEDGQYRMQYFWSGLSGGSYLDLEWTNQHGCGVNDDKNQQKVKCQLVLQYMCQDDVETATGTNDTLRNGQSTQSQDYNHPENLDDSATERQTRKVSDVTQEKGLHESWDYYDKCFVRERNKGLFTADQTLKRNNGLGVSSAAYTRQNNRGGRSGYECPEERDYYPYWHPTAWKDIAVMTDDISRCSFYKTQSFNKQPYHECVEMNNGERLLSKYNNAADCTGEGTWTAFHNYLEKDSATTEGDCLAKTNAHHDYIWGVPHDTEDPTKKECLVALEKPDCKPAEYSRVNHLGNGADLKMNGYTWKLPHFPSGKTKRCVIRMRYNISTDDYDPYNTDYTSNQLLEPQQDSPVTNNPKVDVGSDETLQLNINPDQFGRTFQDRSHVFKMRSRPGGILDSAKLYNLNVRGKRGNIVQTIPATEYDFSPRHTRINEGDLVHIQWAGSNTHDNNKPGGDGATGDDGQGKGGTDRHNMVQIKDRALNYPMPYEMTTMWNNTDIIWSAYGEMTKLGLAMCMATNGHITDPTNLQPMDANLDDTKASFEGVVLKFKKGKYHYMCSRNNAFTNRSQKGTIIVNTNA